MVCFAASETRTYNLDRSTLYGIKKFQCRKILVDAVPKERKPLYNKLYALVMGVNPNAEVVMSLVLGAP